MEQLPVLTILVPYRPMDPPLPRNRDPYRLTVTTPLHPMEPLIDPYRLTVTTLLLLTIPDPYPPMELPLATIIVIITIIHL